MSFLSAPNSKSRRIWERDELWVHKHGAEPVAPVDPPEAFTEPDWSVRNAWAPGGQGVYLTITTLPADSGSPITDIEGFNLSIGAWVSIGQSTPGEYLLTVNTPASTELFCEIRAVNANGPGPASDTKAVTPRPPTVPQTPQQETWTLEDQPSAAGNMCWITLLSYTDPQGSPLTGHSQRSQRVDTPGFSGWFGLAPPLPALGVPVSVTLGARTNGEFQVQLRASNANGNSGGLTKNVTCTLLPPLAVAASAAKPKRGKA